MASDINNGDNGRERQLFGGALTCFLPNNAQDMSVVREIPDNQEVFCHESTDQSLMFDILEYQQHVHGEEAARYHFTDIADYNEANGEAEVTLVEAIPKDMICMDRCSEAWFLFGRQMVSKFNEDSTSKNLLHIFMVLYRLQEFETDLLVLMNNPIAISKTSSSSNNATSSSPSSSNESGWTQESFKQMACTLKLIDTSLFGGES